MLNASIELKNKDHKSFAENDSPCNFNIYRERKRMSKKLWIIPPKNNIENNPNPKLSNENLRSIYHIFSPVLKRKPLRLLLWLVNVANDKF